MTAVPTAPAEPVPPLLPEAALVRVRALARRLCGCDHLAADVVQEALIACWRRPEPPADAVAWLARAVVLRCRQLHRSLRRRQHHEHGAACELHRGCDNPLHQAVAHELGERLDAALAALPAEQRDALALYVDTGLDYAGIAARLDLPVGTVRSRLHRARATLAACV
ncbi:MAG: sigma-70 family RNA polymerase sigma factor [Planctomycetes bacterium]|nr:sigma-70 family RNA polymerase sigma factor [Planctomycetota bacterium]MCB9885478.1 sigma-70 family RNA polymerase sigma factor [Planctomycetota bacterium]